MRSESSSRAAVPLAVLTMLFGALWVESCNAYEPPADTGGVTLGSGLCGALTVVAVDDSYASSSVAVLGFDGSVESASIVSAASKKVGLSAALSGDVVLPTAPTRAPHFVVVDRTASALLWIDAERGKVEGQLSVQFPRGGVAKNANPQDYVETSAHKAYVSRYNDNP